MVREPFELSFSITNIKSGFAKCGIFPLDQSAVPISKILPSTLYGGEPSEQGALQPISNVSSGHPSSPSAQVLASDTASEYSSSSVAPQSSQSPDLPSGATSSVTFSVTSQSGENPLVSTSSSTLSANSISNPLVKAGLIASNFSRYLGGTS